MRHLLRIRWIPALAMLSAAALACSLLPAGGQSAAGGEPSRGSGSFDLPEGMVGLAALKAYHATLGIQFQGSEDGQPSQWTETYDIARTQTPANWVLTMDSTGLPSDQSLAGMLSGEISGVDYGRAGTDGPCSAAAIEGQAAAQPILEPAQLLPPVLGAEKVGSAETLNGLAVNHYRFDERAVNAAGQAKASGEVWVATEGGYVVEYTLDVEGDEGYFGQGLQGTMSWDYELGEANGAFAVEPPPDCPPGMVDAPIMPEATRVVNQPGVLMFATAASVKEAAAFYEEKLSALAWQSADQPLVADDLALLDFQQGDRRLSLVVTSSQGVTKVRILLERAAPSASPTPTGLLPTPAANASGRISNSLNLTLGIGEQSAVL